MLHLDPLAPLPPRLPRRWQGAVAPRAASAAFHVALLVALIVIEGMMIGNVPVQPAPVHDVTVTPLVFLMPENPRAGGGGGGGGNRQPGPIRRAESAGADAVTLRTRTAPVPAREVPVDAVLPPAVLLDAKPLASGVLEQTGLPMSVIASGTSTGSGSGGGVGTGTGTGIGPGSGPGYGPGSGGGTGGGVYRAGGSVSAPQVITQVRPRYTPEALRRKIQGTVVLEAVVRSDGCPSQIRVVRSLDPGLDEEAMLAAAQWRFEPGRLDGVAVDVLVTIMLDFMVR